MTEQDEWSIGILYGFCRVQDTYGNYPTVCAPFIRLALKVIRQHHLAVHRNALEFARRWLKEVERQPTRIEKLLAELEETRLNPAQRVRVRGVALNRPVNTCKRSQAKRRTAQNGAGRDGPRTLVRVLSKIN